MPLLASAQRQPVAPAASGPAVPLRWLRWRALGTDCEIQYACVDDARAQAFERAAVAWVEAFEARYSRFRSDSLVSRINAAAGAGWVEIDEEMERFLDVSGSLHFLSQGVLDVTALPLLRLWDYKAAVPRVPSHEEIAAARRLVGWHKLERAPGRVRLPEVGMGLDFGGWGKEYAVDAVAGLAREHGLVCALVDFGRDLCAVGAAPGKPGWHVGLEDPAHPGECCWASLALQDRAVACSGDYARGFTIDGRRYGHIIDPRTGMPAANDVRQVTVIASSCLQAGALSTTAFILGPEAGLRRLQETMGVDGCILTTDTRHQTRGFLNHVVSS